MVAPVDVAAADFTGDGLLDLAVSRNNQADIVVLRNEGAAGFAQFLTVPVGQSPNYLITSDFNRDGRADLVVSNAASGTYLGVVRFRLGLQRPVLLGGFVADRAVGARPDRRRHRGHPGHLG